MKTRILSAAVALPLFLLVLLVCPLWATTVLTAAMAVLAARELLLTAKLAEHKRMFLWSSLTAVAVVVWSGFGCPKLWGMAIVWIYCTAAFCELLAAHTEFAFPKLCVCAFAALAVPYFLAAIVRILHMEYGRYLVLLIFVLAFTSDSGAYFVGRAMGKHKLAPVISPKKTVEGFVGGIVSCVLCTLLYGFILWKGFGFSVNWWASALVGAVGSLGSVLGDLTFSVIKRQCGIKDYGNVLPGHGGILDRFDSTIVTAPLTELALLTLPMIWK